MNNEIAQIITNLDKQIGRLELSMFNFDTINQPYLPSHTKNNINDEIQRLRDIQDNIRNDMIKLGEVQRTLTNDNKVKNSLQKEINALDITIMKLQEARNENLPTNTKNRLTIIINYLADTRNKIATHIAQFGQTSPTYIQKMIAGAKALCEEHEDIVKNIIGEPTINCVTNDVATTPSANINSDTPCFENIEELNK